MFHFLTDPADRQRYRAAAERAVSPGGHLILGTFATHGPERCSGLPVCRYDVATLNAALGPSFRLIDERSYDHRTPAGQTQPFVFGIFRKVP
ncbi:MAG: hypothetical protein U0935_16270 [Pirellulales bacterium]